MTEIIIVIEKWTKLGTIRKVPNSFRPCSKSMGQNILNGHVGKTIGGTRSTEQVEPMANGEDISEG